MTISARFAGLFRLLTATGFPALARSYQTGAGVTFGPARPTETPPSADGLAQLQARRLELIEEAQRQKNLRRSKQASSIEASLRAVTHQILSTRTRPHA